MPTTGILMPKSISMSNIKFKLQLLCPLDRHRGPLFFDYVGPPP